MSRPASSFRVVKNLLRGGAAVARRPHKPEVAGSIPALASILLLAGRYRLPLRETPSNSAALIPLGQPAGRGAFS